MADVRWANILATGRIGYRRRKFPNPPMCSSYEQWKQIVDYRSGPTVVRRGKRGGTSAQITEKLATKIRDKITFQRRRTN